MRTAYSSGGGNVTAAVNSAMQNAGGALILADIYTISMSSPWTGAGVTYYSYTSAAYPISAGSVQVGPSQFQTLGTALPNPIERGNLEYSVGLSSTSFEWTWYPDDTIPIPGSTYTWKGAALSGLLSACTFFLHRAIFAPDPNNQAGALLGTALMWKGMIQEVEVKAEYIKMTVPSIMQVFQDVQVPTQVVQAGPRIAPYLPTGSTTSISGLNAGASTSTDLHFGSGPVDHSLRDGFLTGFSGSPASGTSRPSGVRIIDNVTSGGVMHVLIADPVDPASLPGSCTVYLPQNIGSTTNPQEGGFTSLPPPEASI